MGAGQTLYITSMTPRKRRGCQGPLKASAPSNCLPYRDKILSGNRTQDLKDLRLHSYSLYGF